jgi:hypothetical protein
MDSRQSKRFIIDLPAEVIINDKRHAGTIANLSEEGIYVITAPSKSSKELTPDTDLELRFQFPSGEKMALKCRIQWAYQTPPHGYTTSVGLMIVNAPLMYKQMLQTIT